MGLEFHGNAITFFNAPVPRLAEETFFPDHYNPRDGTFKQPSSEVASVSYISKTKLVRDFKQFHEFQSLDRFSSNGESLKAYALCREKDSSTILLRHNEEVVGSYEPSVLFVAETHRRRGLSTILILAKMAVTGSPANPDRPMSVRGARAFESAYSWLRERNLVD